MMKNGDAGIFHVYYSLNITRECLENTSRRHSTSPAAETTESKTAASFRRSELKARNRELKHIARQSKLWLVVVFWGGRHKKDNKCCAQHAP